MMPCGNDYISLQCLCMIRESRKAKTPDIFAGFARGLGRGGQWRAGGNVRNCEFVDLSVICR